MCAAFFCGQSRERPVSQPHSGQRQEACLARNFSPRPFLTSAGCGGSSTGSSAVIRFSERSAMEAEAAEHRPVKASKPALRAVANQSLSVGGVLASRERVRQPGRRRSDLVRSDVHVVDHGGSADRGLRARVSTNWLPREACLAFLVPQKTSFQDLTYGAWAGHCRYAPRSWKMLFGGRRGPLGAPEATFNGVAKHLTSSTGWPLTVSQSGQPMLQVRCWQPR